MRKHRAQFRFHEELNDFLPAGRRKTDIAYEFDGFPAVKDSIEALGVPHSEVDLIVANGASVRFDYRLRDGDRVAVYPCFEALDIGPLQKLRESPLREPAFVLDVHLGKLARLLRLLGFDAAYRNDYRDREIVTLSVTERRIVLTRDRRLLFHRVITHGYFVRSTDATEQAREVVTRLDLAGRVRPFSRCLACNGTLEGVAKAAIEDRLEPLTRRYHSDFSRCMACSRVYWKGSHYDRLLGRLTAMLG
jgi:uncharacterized protein with PIN domain